jgi:hypothetical protein
MNYDKFDFLIHYMLYHMEHDFLSDPPNITLRHFNDYFDIDKEAYVNINLSSIPIDNERIHKYIQKWNIINNDNNIINILLFLDATINTKGAITDSLNKYVCHHIHIKHMDDFDILQAGNVDDVFSIIQKTDGYLAMKRLFIIAEIIL